MNTKHVEKQFEQIGARFIAKPYEEVHHLGDYAGWRNRIHRPELRIKAKACVLVYERSFTDLLDVRGVVVPQAEDMLVLSIGYFNTELKYLCHLHEGRLITREITDNKEPLSEHVATLRELTRPPRSRRKQQRTVCALSYTAANQRVPMTERQYETYIQLAQACRNTKIMQEQGPVVAGYGHHETNTYLTALMRIATCHEQWQRAAADWKAGSRNPDKAFQDLLRHLFGPYPVPEFLATVWFRRRENWIPCYIEVARGANIRNVAAFTFPLTKKMAHHLMEAPERFTMEEAVRWGQVRGLGGNARFYGAINGTRMTPVDRNNPKGHAFWQTVIEWLLRHPMLATEHYGPLVDYIRQERRKNPAFSMAGRSPQVLLRQTEAWHAALNQTRRGPGKLPERWTGHNLEWWCTDRDSEGDVTDWRVTEIVQAERLFEEGKAMKHCVSSYAWGCARGRMAICSLQCNGVAQLTVEYMPATHQIGEVRGKMNRIPTAEEWDVLRRWAEAKNLG